MTNRVSVRKTSLEDYTAKERERFAKLWDTLVHQAKTDGERARRVRIAHYWRHLTNGVVQDFTESRTSLTIFEESETNKEPWKAVLPKPKRHDAKSNCSIQAVYS